MLACLLLAVVPAALPAQSDDRTVFLEQWSQNQKVGDYEAMGRILRKHRDVAIQIFIERADRRAVVDHADLNDWVDSFIETWGRTFKSGFAENYDAYLQMMNERTRNLRAQLINENWPSAFRLYMQAFEDKQLASWIPAQQASASLMVSFESVGDLYYFAEAANAHGNGWLESLNPDGADPAKAYAALLKVQEARERLGLTQDKLYADVKRMVDDLSVTAGIVKTETEDLPGGRAAKESPYLIPPAPESTWTELAFSPGFTKKPLAISHSCDLADNQRLSWRVDGADKAGGKRQIKGITPPVFIKTLAIGRFVLQAGDADSEEFRLSPVPVAVTVPRKHEDGSVLPCTLWLAGGQEQDPFHGAALNTAPNEFGAYLFWRSLNTRMASTPFGSLTFYDLDGDGMFGSPELRQDPLGTWGLLPETGMYRFDAISLGKSKTSQPWSKWISDSKGNWYELGSFDHLKGQSAMIRPVEPKLGKISFSFKGLKKLKLQSLLVASDVSATKGLVIDLCALKGKTVQIPIGRYKFLQARLTTKNGEVMVLPPQAGFPAFDIEQDNTVKLAFGAPFQVAASTKQEGKQLTILGETVHLKGKAGERYMRFFGEPLVGFDVKAKGAKTVQLLPPTVALIMEKWGRAYYPQDAVLEFSKETKDPTITLSLKKHPWFGKLSNKLP